MKTFITKNDIKVSLNFQFEKNVFSVTIDVFCKENIKYYGFGKNNRFECSNDYKLKCITKEFMKDFVEGRKNILSLNEKIFLEHKEDDIFLYYYTENVSSIFIDKWEKEVLNEMIKNLQFSEKECNYIVKNF